MDKQHTTDVVLRGKHGNIRGRRDIHESAYSFPSSSSASTETVETTRRREVCPGTPGPLILFRASSVELTRPYKPKPSVYPKLLFHATPHTPFPFPRLKLSSPTFGLLTMPIKATAQPTEPAKHETAQQDTKAGFEPRLSEGGRAASSRHSSAWAQNP